MGLDQYAFYAKRGIDINDKEALGNAFKDNEFMYWRKRYNVDNWMRSLYYSRGGKGDFNCNVVRVSEEDLRNLEEASKDISFYENGYYMDPPKDMKDEKPQIDKFIKLARKHIDEGYDIYYTNWW